MNLKEIISKIEVREEWQDRYQKFIPLFIDSAKKYENWQDWNPDVFYEFFEKNREQCVSSLQQGYYDKSEILKIKQNWNLVAPLLNKLAQEQELPDWKLYDEIQTLIRSFTKQNKQASTNRLIASLQPQLLCTIVADDHLKSLYKKLHFEIKDNSFPKYQTDKWFENSYNILQYFKNELVENDGYKIMTFPWQLKDEWLPKGYDRFHDAVSAADKIIVEQKLPFKIGKIKHKHFVWISDEKGIIGNTIAHYEFLNKSNIISVDLHFEENKSKDIFHKNIGQLPEKLSWKKWESNYKISRWKKKLFDFRNRSDSKKVEDKKRIRNGRLYKFFRNNICISK